MPRPGCPPPVSSCPARRAVAIRLSPTGWHGCRFPLVRWHRMRNGAGKPVTELWHSFGLTVMTQASVLGAPRGSADHDHYPWTRPIPHAPILSVSHNGCHPGREARRDNGGSVCLARVPGRSRSVSLACLPSGDPERSGAFAADSPGCLYVEADVRDCPHSRPPRPQEHQPARALQAHPDQA